MSEIKLNKIHFKIVPITYLVPKDKDEPKIPFTWEQVRPIIDDREILDWVGSDEEDPHWGMESFEFIKLENELYNGKLIIGICLSSIIGCHDIVVDISTSDNYVSWKVYHDKESEKREDFIFDKTEYTMAIEDARTKVTQMEKFLLKERFTYHERFLDKEKSPNSKVFRFIQ